MEIRTVGVVGCGTMGSGIAQVCARSGYMTHVVELSQGLLERGLGGIRAALQREVDRRRMEAGDRDQALARLSGSTDLKDLAACDLVVEAVVEDLAVKRETFAAMDRACAEGAVLASNTSSLPIVELAAATRRPAQVVGVHFFNPVPVMKLVELVPSIVTAGETLATARAFAESLGKTTVVAKDAPGFIVNRLLVPYLLDAIRVYESGLAEAEELDRAMALGLNHPMGPLALSDLVGLDVVLSIAETLHRELGEPRFAAPTLLRRLVSAGHVGRKAGRGFYGY